MEEERKSPDMLLKAIKKDPKSRHGGDLKIFFGYAAGVGKTYTMLKAAHELKEQGVDVVVGYVEPHGRKGTEALLKGLPQIPPYTKKYNGLNLIEFDVDAAIARKPELVLVDEIAHTNVEGSRNKKRYQDIKELLKAGIDVYTTVNVQHIESLYDIVAGITGISVRERIPDTVFDGALQVELVDIEPQELIERLKSGKIYRETQAKKALENFFTVDNLTALREIALRRCADQIKRTVGIAKATESGSGFTDEHILACISPSVSNQKIVRTAARMAQAFQGAFTALYVKPSDFDMMSDKDLEQLHENMKLAEQLGATLETTYGDDEALQIAEFSRISGVSKVVLGRSNAGHRRIFGRKNLTERLTIYAPNLDTYIIPTNSKTTNYAERNNRHEKLTALDTIKTILIIALSTGIGFAFDMLNFSPINIIMVYILGILITAVVTNMRLYSVISSVACVLTFNFFFTVPRFTFNAYESGYPTTFIVMLIVALITSNLALRIKSQARDSAQLAYRNKVMFDTNQALQKADGEKEIVSVTASQLNRLLGRSIVFYSAKEDSLDEPVFFGVKDCDDKERYTTINEMAVASWVFKNNKRAGATTDTLASAKCLYYSIRIENSVYGVIGVVIGKEPLEVIENSILLAIIGECAMALENEKTAMEKEKVAVLAKNEQLRANLLRSISHDLRTPLTSISGNAAVLMSNYEAVSAEKRRLLLTDIYDDSLWLINLVENLLSVTRIEEGSMQLKTKPELIDEVIEEAIRHIGRKSAEHNIKINTMEDFVFAKMDVRLILQVIINILDNAIKYTPKGSEITVTPFVEGKWLNVEIADNGPGISGDAKPHIFEMFYTAETKVADSRRSMGLGLALCKSIVNAHGGEIFVYDNKPTGTVFKFTLPVEEVELYE